MPVHAATTAITGVVTDAGTSAPIAGVQVVTQPASATATTDSSGSYDFNEAVNVTAGAISVDLSKK